MPPEKQFTGWCREHSLPHYDAICPRCVGEELYPFNPLKVPDMSRLEAYLTQSTSAEPVNLGRLEDNTQEDREFLQSCGITVD